MLLLNDIIKELRYKHSSYFSVFGHEIPSAFLSFSACEYLAVISKARASVTAYNNHDKISEAERLYKDFVDPTGKYEMEKTFQKLLFI